MMDKKNLKSSLQKTVERHDSRRGAFSAAAAVLAVAAVVVFNLIAAQLPERWSQLDMTGSGIYNISETSRTYLAGLEDDVEIHVLADRDAVDSRITRFLDKYVELSDHLSLEYIDPLVYPSALSEYGVESDTVVVTCEATGRQESFALAEVVGYDVMAYLMNNTYTETDFDGEGLMTSAIDGVLTDATRTVYTTAGHEEMDLPAAVTDRLDRLHISVESVNLLLDGGVPEDCSLLILNAPTDDLADDELTMIRDYLAQGGQVIYNMASSAPEQPNFQALCADYGMDVADGSIWDLSRYYQNTPNLFFPVVNTSVDAAGGLLSDSMVLILGARGLTLTDPVRDTITVESFLTTSENGYAVVDAEHQTQGVYTVGAVATEEVGEDATARLTVYGSSSIIDESLLTMFPNLDNLELFLHSATLTFEDVSDISIEPVDLSTPTNVITTGGFWALLFVLVLPAVLLIFGFVRWLHRRKL